MKKVLALVLAVVMLVGLVGCGSKPATQPAAPEAEGEAAVDDQLARIQAAGKFVVGIEGTFYPFTYHDENDELAGFDVEIAKGIAEHLGVEADFFESQWDSLFAGMDSGRCDTVINDVSVTDERREKYDFADPYFFVFRQVVVHADNDDIHGFEDLAGKRCGTSATNSYVSTLEELGVEVVAVADTYEAANHLENGRVDFCLFDPTVLGGYLEEHPESPIKVAFVITDSVDEVAVPVLKGEERLLAEVNAALDEMRADGTLEALSEKYFKGNYTVDPRA